MSDEEDKCVCPDGIPAWVMTFADLMSLLMCFFVLLLSFSEMDLQKYKQIAGSMKMAFGVQSSIPAHEIPKGTSIIAKQFSPGKPTKTILSKIQQDTADKSKEKLEVETAEEVKIKQDARKIADTLKTEISEGKLEIEVRDKDIIIRIQEENSFGSGNAKLNLAFEPVINKIRDAIGNVEGTIKVGGHTDDLPISTPEYRSNWELSTARAVSVAHVLMSDGQLEENRFEIVGYADTKPIYPNTTKENRAKNRRVDIIIHQAGGSAEDLMNE